MLTKSQPARAVGLSADPRSPTPPVEDLIVLSRFPHAFVSVSFTRGPAAAAPRVYVLPRPSGVTGALRFVKPRPLGKLSGVTAPSVLTVEPHSFQATGVPCLDTENILPDRIVSAYSLQGATFAHDATPPPPQPVVRKTRAELMLEDVFPSVAAPRPPQEVVVASECKEAPAAALPYRVASGAELAGVVRSLGGALPVSFEPAPTDSFWVIENREGRSLPGVQFQVHGAFTMPLVAAERGGSRETLLIALSDDQLSGATGPLTQKGIVSAFLPRELEGLEAGGTYALPDGLDPSKSGRAVALVAEPAFRRGASIVLEMSARVHSPNIAREACGAAGLRALDALAPGFVYNTFVVRARVRSAPRLTFENRVPPRRGTTAILHFEARPEVVDEKSCWRVKQLGITGHTVLDSTDPLVPIPKVSLRSPLVAAPPPPPTAAAGRPNAPGALSAASVTPASPPRGAAVVPGPLPVQPCERGCSASGSTRLPAEARWGWPALGLLAALARRRAARRTPG